MDERADLIKKAHKSMGRPKKNLEAEERAKREVANSNERRRMQSINNGFSCLRQILRQHNSIEKHSKAAILHQSANYIRKLEEDIKHFTEQNQILKNFVDSYQNKNENQSIPSEQCSEERVEISEDSHEEEGEEEEDSSPNKKMKTCDDIEVNTSSDESESTGSDSTIVNKDSALQNPQELTQILEKEVHELKTLLERERLMRAGLEERQHNIGFRFEPNTCSALLGVSPRVPFPATGFPINPMLSTPSQQRPLTVGFHNNSNEKPLNLMTTKNSFNGFPMSSMPFANYPLFGQTKTFSDFRSRYNHRMISPNLYPTNVQINKQATNELKTEKKDKRAKGIPHPFPNESNCALPLIKKQTTPNHSGNTSLTSTSATVKQSQSTGSKASVTELKDRSSAGLKENLELILKAIQHIEGEEVLKTRDSMSSAYVKHLTEKMNFSSASVLKQLLSEEYQNNKLRTTVDSEDSLH